MNIPENATFHEIKSALISMAIRIEKLASLLAENAEEIIGSEDWLRDHEKLFKLSCSYEALESLSRDLANEISDRAP